MEGGYWKKPSGTRCGAARRSVPVLSYDDVSKIITLNSEILKDPTNRHNSKSKLFVAKAKTKLFDIYVCKCTDFS